MPRKPISAKKGRRASTEENSSAGANLDDLLVSEEDLARHTINADNSVTLRQVRAALSKIKGSLVSDIREGRDQR